MTDAFGIYRGKRVLVTGHRGFKGGWLMEWLDMLGARPFGLSIDPPYTPCLGTVLSLNQRFDCETIDIRDAAAVAGMVRRVKPDIIFHMAAQPLVRLSYATPVETFDSNVQGTVHVLEAIRAVGVPAGVMITSDKVYRNDDLGRPFKESDALGGHDPYSMSKAMAEMAIASFRHSYFTRDGAPLIATVRAGNIIGGGDWSADRLLPDIVRAILVNRTELMIRRPRATRPWQHVLDALDGYLRVGASLLAGEQKTAGAWNFGPKPSDSIAVEAIVRHAINHLGEGSMRVETMDDLHEAGQLTLDTRAAQKHLRWKPKLDVEAAIRSTLDWYKAYYGRAERDMIAVTRGQIERLDGQRPAEAKAA
jgi:CDP-glucose 4,6-dehydratase